MKVLQTPTFERKYKKLNRNELGLLNEAIDAVIDNPQIGELKRGDLGDIRVYKARTGRREVLLAYLSAGNSLKLLDFGSHENFYRELKRRLR
jgi:mRNA-degrading endonuclease RelE of RelBE toxin-antitoxin system